MIEVLLVNTGSLGAIKYVKILHLPNSSIEIYDTPAVWSLSDVTSLPEVFSKSSIPSDLADFYRSKALATGTSIPDLKAKNPEYFL